MTDSNSKGTRGERKLRDRLNEWNWAVMRTPASGSGTPYDLPDILAGQGAGNVVASESKWLSDGIIYVDGEKLAALAAFAYTFGAVPVISARWDGDTTWYHAHIHNVPRTRSGNASFKPRYTDEPWVVKTSQLFEYVNNGDENDRCARCGTVPSPKEAAPPDTVIAHGALTLCQDCLPDDGDSITKS